MITASSSETWTHEIPKPPISACHLLPVWPKSRLHIQPAWAQASSFGKGECPSLYMAVLSGPTFDPLTTCVSVSNLSWQNLPLWEVLQEVEPQSLLIICWKHEQGQHGAHQDLNLSWTAKNSNTNRQFCEDSEQPHLSNPVWSWAVVIQQPVEEFKAAGFQPVAWSSPFINPEPVDRSGMTGHISWRKQGRQGRIVQEKHPLPSPATHTTLGGRMYQWY